LGSETIALISATAFEADKIIKLLKGVSRQGVPIKGRLFNKKIIYIQSGMGIANSAHAVTLLIERYSPKIIINFGIGGAYPDTGLGIGDVIFAEKEIYADTGVLLREGFRDTKEIGIPLLIKGKKRYFNEFPLDEALIKRAKGLGFRSGVFLTVSASTGILTRAIKLRDIYEAVCESMEGASVAHIGTIYGVRVSELRSISNIVEDRDPEKWDKKKASSNCQDALLEFIKTL